MDEDIEEEFQRGQRAKMGIYEDYSGLFDMVQVGGSNGIDPELLDKFNSLGYTTYIIPTTDKPIKIVFEDYVEVNSNGTDIEIRTKLHGIEAEKFITDLFGTTHIGIFDCSDIKEEFKDDEKNKIKTDM